MWLKLTVYKNKSAQIFPTSSSRIMEENIDNVLWILETKKHIHTLENFESWLKLFLTAKIYKDYKTIVEDMSWTLDEFIKEFTWVKSKSFKSVFKNGEYVKYGLDWKNKEIFKQFKNYIDDIKHWTTKDISRNDIDMIINQTALFIIYVINSEK